MSTCVTRLRYLFFQSSSSTREDARSQPPKPRSFFAGPDQRPHDDPVQFTAGHRTAGRTLSKGLLRNRAGRPRRSSLSPGGTRNLGIHPSKSTLLPDRVHPQYRHIHPDSKAHSLAQRPLRPDDGRAEGEGHRPAQREAGPSRAVPFGRRDHGGHVLVVITHLRFRSVCRSRSMCCTTCPLCFGGAYQRSQERITEARGAGPGPGVVWTEELGQ